MSHAKRRAPQERRRSILEAAQSVLLDRDYYEIKMDEIARKANVAKGTLYLYFPTKEKLFEALARDMVHRTFEEWKGIWARTGPGLERLKALIRAQLEFFEENRGIFVQIFQGNLPHCCMDNRRRAHIIRGNVQTLARALGEAMKLGQLRKSDALLTAVGLFGLIRGFVFARILGHMPGRLPGRTELIWDMFYRGMRP